MGWTVLENCVGQFYYQNSPKNNNTRPINFSKNGCIFLYTGFLKPVILIFGLEGMDAWTFCSILSSIIVTATLIRATTFSWFITSSRWTIFFNSPKRSNPTDFWSGDLGGHGMVHLFQSQEKFHSGNLSLTSHNVPEHHNIGTNSLI